MTEEQPGVGEEMAVVDEDAASEELDAQAKLKEAIDVRMEDVGTLRKKLSITVPRDAIDERLGDQFSELKRDAMVPGFRKGRAPLRLIEKRFGHEVGDQLISQLVSSGYLAAVDKVEIKPLGDPLIWIGTSGEGDGERLVTLDKALAEMELPSEGPLTFSCEVELRPQFELPELDGIPVDKPKVEIGDDDVDAEIDRFRSMRGQFVPVSGGSVEPNDLVVGDLTMTIGRTVVKDEKNASLPARGQIIEGVVVEHLAEALAGTNVEETATFEATVGDDHDNLAYRGQTASFSFTVHDIKRMELPPLDQAFIEMLGFDSEAEMRSQLRTALASRLDTVIQRGLRGQIGRYLLEHTEMEVPAGLTQRQTERLVAKRMVELYQRGVPEQEIAKQADELRARAGEDTTTELKLFFIMEKVAEKMELDVHDDELNGAIASIAAQQGKRFDRVRDELSKGQGLTALYLQLRDDKILDALLQKAVITETEGPKKKTATTTSKKKIAAKSTEKKAAAGKTAASVTERTSTKTPGKKTTAAGSAKSATSAVKKAATKKTATKKKPAKTGTAKKTTKKKAGG